MRRRSFLCALLPASPLVLAPPARAQGPTPVPVRFGGTGVGLSSLQGFLIKLIANLMEA